jgi:enoyl-CoA hydratase/carnithine racemase
MKKIEFQMDGNLAIIKLNAPPVNVISSDLLREFDQCLNNLDNEHVRGLLLCANGDNFSAGADVSIFSSLSPIEAQELFSGFFSILHKAESLPYPTMAAVQGICIAGGFELALSMDMIWAADTALLGQAEALIGAIPFGGGSQRLAARCGTARAKEIIYTGRFFKSEQMERYNVLNRVVPADELFKKARKFMSNLADNGPTKAYAAMKDILIQYQNGGMESADRLTIQQSAQMFATEDLHTGIESFLKQGPGKAKFNGK